MYTYNSMFDMYDANAYLLKPSRFVAERIRDYFSDNDTLTKFGWGRFAKGLADTYERSTRYVKKPEFKIDNIEIDGDMVKVYQTAEMKLPFADLLHFTKVREYQGPKVLIIAPVSGHFATLLRDTVKRMLVRHDVYITDWKSLRDVPLSAGSFGLDTYMSYLIDFMHHIGSNTHVLAVCQPAVQVMALAALLDEANDPCLPATIVPMGGPIDPRINKTQVNRLAEEYPLSWFERNFLTYVPAGHIGVGRRVYPGFVQLTAFINMNPDAHYKKHMQYLEACIQGNESAMNKHKEFYDEYFSVLDMDDVYYLETVEKIFQKFELPRGVMKYKGHKIDLGAIRHCALMTVEGEHDDISAPGQCYAAHDLAENLPRDMHSHHLQPGVGHYGVFSGSKWRAFVAPKIEEFIQKFDREIGGYYRKKVGKA